MQSHQRRDKSGVNFYRDSVLVCRLQTGVEDDLRFERDVWPKGVGFFGQDIVRKGPDHVGFGRVIPSVAILWNLVVSVCWFHIEVESSWVELAGDLVKTQTVTEIRKHKIGDSDLGFRTADLRPLLVVRQEAVVKSCISA